MRVIYSYRGTTTHAHIQQSPLEPIIFSTTNEHRIMIDRP